MCQAFQDFRGSRVSEASRESSGGSDLLDGAVEEEVPTGAVDHLVQGDRLEDPLGLEGPLVLVARLEAVGDLEAVEDLEAGEDLEAVEELEGVAQLEEEVELSDGLEAGQGDDQQGGEEVDSSVGAEGAEEQSDRDDSVGQEPQDQEWLKILTP